jgi:hypothetical protein
VVDILSVYVWRLINGCISWSFLQNFDGIKQPVLNNPKFAVTRNPLGFSFLWQS